MRKGVGMDGDAMVDRDGDESARRGRNVAANGNERIYMDGGIKGYARDGEKRKGVEQMGG